MPYLAFVTAIVLLASAGLLVWQVQRDFFAALEAEYDRQLSRDPAYRKRMKASRRPLGEKARRQLRRGLRRLKAPFYLLAAVLGVKRR